MPSNLPLTIDVANNSFMRLGDLASLTIPKELADQFPSIRGVARERKEFWRGLCNYLYEEGCYSQSDFDYIYHIIKEISSLHAEYTAATCVRQFEPLSNKVISVYKLELFFINFSLISEIDINEFIDEVISAKGLAGVDFFVDLFQALADKDTLDVERVINLVKFDQHFLPLYEMASTPEQYVRIIDAVCDLEEFQEEVEEENVLSPSGAVLLEVEQNHFNTSSSLRFFPRAESQLEPEQSFSSHRVPNSSSLQG